MCRGNNSAVLPEISVLSDCYNFVNVSGSFIADIQKSLYSSEEGCVCALYH